MRKKLKSMGLLLVLALGLSLTPGGQRAEAAVQSYPVLLKINDYYVLHTDPKPPYIDANGRMLIPLRATGELIGANVGYLAASKTATIDLNGIRLQFEVGSRTVGVNGKAETMDTVPAMKENAMYIPISVFADRLGIQSKWDAKNRLYTLTGTNLMTGQLIKFGLEDTELGSRIAPPKPVVSNDAFVPVSFTYDTSKDSYTVVAKNKTGKAVSAGRADVAVYLLNNDAVQFPAQKRARPAVGANGTVKETVKNELQGKAKYVLVKGRLLQQ